MKEIEIEGIKCVGFAEATGRKVTYIIYPQIELMSSSLLEEMAKEFSTWIVVVYIPADGWNDMLTPWPEPGETPDSPSFAGKANATLSLLQNKIIPEMEKELSLSGNIDRDLIGVSLSGLFSLWQWLNCDVFKSIGSLSGSFWYEGFIDWFDRQQIQPKTGEAYFLLGKKEPHAWIRAYRSVGKNTEQIVERLQTSGIEVTFDWVAGDHYSDPAGRLRKALEALNKPTSQG